MFYFVSGIIIGLLVFINGYIKFKESKSIFLVSLISGIGLFTSGVLGIIFTDYEFIFDISLTLFAVLYIVFSIIINKKNKK